MKKLKNNKPDHQSGLERDTVYESLGPLSEGNEMELDASQLLGALRTFKRGDFSVRLPDGLTGISGQIAEAFNDAITFNESLAKEFERISIEVGREGRIKERVSIGAPTGSWKKSTDSANTLS